MEVQIKTLRQLVKNKGPTLNSQKRAADRGVFCCGGTHAEIAIEKLDPQSKLEIRLQQLEQLKQQQRDHEAMLEEQKRLAEEERRRQLEEEEQRRKELEIKDEVWKKAAEERARLKRE